MTNGGSYGSQPQAHVHADFVDPYGHRRLRRQRTAEAERHRFRHAGHSDRCCAHCVTSPARAGCRDPDAACRNLDARGRQRRCFNGGIGLAADGAGCAGASLPATRTRRNRPCRHRKQFNNDPDLRCDILEVKRASGGALLVKWRLSRPTVSTSGLATKADDKAIYHSFSWSGVYVTDPAENKKYSGLKDSQGHWLSQGDNKTYAPGQQQVMWMKFPAPPGSSTKVGFVFPGFAPFDDLPVS